MTKKITIERLLDIKKHTSDLALELPEKVYDNYSQKIFNLLEDIKERIIEDYEFWR